MVDDECKNWNLESVRKTAKTKVIEEAIRTVYSELACL